MSEIKLKPCPFCGGEAVAAKTLKHNLPLIERLKCHAAMLSPNANGAPDLEGKWNERSSMWMSVLDRLPERGVTVMVFSQDGEIYFDEIDEDCDDGDRWYAHDQSYEHYCNVAKPAGSVGPDCEAPYTHWMPLPKPPAEGES